MGGVGHGISITQNRPLNSHPLAHPSSTRYHPICTGVLLNFVPNPKRKSFIPTRAGNQLLPPSPADWSPTLHWSDCQCFSFSVPLRGFRGQERYLLAIKQVCVGGSEAPTKAPQRNPLGLGLQKARAEEVLWKSRDWGYCQRKFSVQNFRVTDIQQLFNHHSSYTTHHTPLITHHSSYTTHHTPLIIHH